MTNKDIHNTKPVKPGNKFNKILLFLFLVTTTLFYFLFYPPIHGIFDENEYLNFTYTIQHGSFFYETFPIPTSAMTIETDSHITSKYPPGNSLLLIPFTTINWKLSFLRTFIFYIAGFFIFYMILKSLSINPIFSFLYLFHPVLLIFSRTLMSDIPSMFFFLLGIYLILKNKLFAAGFILGFTLLIRFTNLFILSGIFLAFAIDTDYKKIFKILPGVLFFAVLITLYYQFVIKDLFLILKFKVDTKLFDIKYLLSSGFFYLLSLNIFFPGMLFLTFFKLLKEQKKFLIFIIPSLITVGLYSFYFFFDKGPDLLSTLIIGQRFIIPVLPLMLIIYAFYLNKFKISKTLILFFIPLVLFSSFYLNYTHYKHLKNKLILRDIFYENTNNKDNYICTVEIGKLVNPFFGNRNINYISKYRHVEFASEIKDSLNTYIVFSDPDKLTEKDKNLLFHLLHKYKLQPVFKTNDPVRFEIHRFIF